jgi:hypothetical protein
MPPDPRCTLDSKLAGNEALGRFFESCPFGALRAPPDRARRGNSSALAARQPSRLGVIGPERRPCQALDAQVRVWGSERSR